MPVLSRDNDSEATGPKDGFTLSDQVPAGATNRAVKVEVDTDATIERMSFRIYPGAELDLELVPYVYETGGGRRKRPILEFGGKEYVDGDDDRYPFEVSEPIEEGEEIVIEATNRDGSNAYDYRVNFDVDYHGGTERGFLASLGGVF